MKVKIIVNNNDSYLPLPLRDDLLIEKLIPQLVEYFRKRGEDLPKQDTEYMLVRLQDGKQLKDSDTFQTAGISDNDKLELKLMVTEPAVDKKTVRVELTDYEGTNTLHNRDVPYDEPLKELAPKLASYLEMPKRGVYTYRIMHTGRWLEENSTLRRAKVKDDDKLVIRPIVLAYIICLEDSQLSLCVARIPGDVSVEELKPIMIRKMGIGGIVGIEMKAQQYRLVHISDQLINSLREGTIWLNDKDTLLKAGTIEGGIIFLLLVAGTDIEVDDFKL